MLQRNPFAIFAIVIILASQVAPVFPQAPANFPAGTSPQDETIRVATSVVQTEAIVTDKTGRRIMGLNASDFVVLDDGKPQRIDYFTSIEASRAQKPETPAATGGNSVSTDGPVSPLTIPYEGRHIALVFDDLNLSHDNFLRSRRAFADYINTKLTKNDMVALISTGGALASLQQFTNDKQRLLSALSRIAAQSKVGDAPDRRPYNITDDEALRIDKGDNSALENVKKRALVEDSGPQGTIADESPTGMGRGSTSLGEKDVLDSRVRTYARAIVSEIGSKARSNLATLKGLFRGMADLPGRKIAVLMTESFVTADGTSEDINSELTQIIELARRSGISVYALDAAGLRTTNVTASEHITGTNMALRNISPDITLSSFEKLNGARRLVAGTGGALIENTNSLIAGLERAIEDSSTYYVLGFKPAVLDNKLHLLSVSVKGKPDLIVRTRRGYLAANPETIGGTEAELVRALKSPVPLMELPVELVANVVPTAGEQVAITGLHIGRNYLTLPAPTAADQTAAYEIVSYVFSSGRDVPLGGVERTVTYDSKNPEERAKLKREGALLLVKEYTQLPPGIYQVRAVVREKTTGAVGSAYQFFEIPNVKDRKTTSMSSIVVTAAGQPAFTGTNSFKPGAEIDMRFIIYHLPKEITGLSQRVKLVDSKGNVLFDSELTVAQPAAQADRIQAPQATRFRLPSARGAYALVVTIKDGKKVDVERRADLVVD